MAARAFNFSDERFSLGILRQLGLQTNQLLKNFRHAARRFSSLAQNLREAIGARNKVVPGTIHLDVTVSFEKTHHAAHLIENCPLFRTSDQIDQSAIGKWFLSGTNCSSDPSDGLAHTSWVGVDGVHCFVNESEEMFSEPRHARELRAMCDLVQRKPHAELFGRKRKLFFERKNVWTHVINDVLVLRILFFDHE